MKCVRYNTEHDYENAKIFQKVSFDDARTAPSIINKRQSVV